MLATTPIVMIQARADDMTGSRGHPGGGGKNEAKSLRIHDADYA